MSVSRDDTRIRGTRVYGVHEGARRECVPGRVSRPDGMEVPYEPQTPKYVCSERVTHPRVGLQEELEHR